MENERHLPFVPEFDDKLNESVRVVNHAEWVESSFIRSDQNAQECIGRTVSNKSLSLLFSLVSLVLFLFLARSAYFQLFQGSGLAALAENNKTRIISLGAHRGIFYDRHGVRLSRNIPDFGIAVIGAALPRDTAARMSLYELIAPFADMVSSNIAEQISSQSPYKPFLLVEHLSHEKALQMMSLGRFLQGISIVATERRNYEMTSEMSVSHIFGYTGRITEDDLEVDSGKYLFTDTIGKLGLELAYDDVLRGAPGKKEIEVDALGYEKRILSEEQPRHGANIHLSIDWEMQKKSEQILADILKKANAPSGVLIASDPTSGEILSLVSLPSYDANLFARGISAEDYRTLLNNSTYPLINRSIGGEYPSGSTIKMVVAAAALQEGVVDERSTFVSSGGISIGKFFFPDWKAGGHGVTNVVKALAESVNTYFYIVGGGYQDKKGLGIERLVDYFSRFGIGTASGIDLPSEHKGFLPTPEWKLSKRHEPWYIGDTYHIAIGQGDILVTPLQIHAITSYFANRGVAYVPHLVKSIEHPNQDSKVQLLEKKTLLQGIVSDSTIDIVRKGMRSGVQSGSSRRLSLLPQEAAGKTGTAQWSSSKPPHAWFTGWYPYENPRIAITVLIEQGEEGSRTAIMAADELLKWYHQL